VSRFSISPLLGFPLSPQSMFHIARGLVSLARLETLCLTGKIDQTHSVLLNKRADHGIEEAGYQLLGKALLHMPAIRTLSLDRSSRVSSHLSDYLFFLSVFHRLKQIMTSYRISEGQITAPLFRAIAEGLSCLGELESVSLSLSMLSAMDDIFSFGFYMKHSAKTAPKSRR
jgi:hypothetical protein